MGGAAVRAVKRSGDGAPRLPLATAIGVPRVPPDRAAGAARQARPTGSARLSFVESAGVAPSRSQAPAVPLTQPQPVQSHSAAAGAAGAGAAHDEFADEFPDDDLLYEAIEKFQFSQAREPVKSTSPPAENASEVAQSAAAMVAAKPREASRTSTDGGAVAGAGLSELGRQDSEISHSGTGVGLGDDTPVVESSALRAADVAELRRAVAHQKDVARRAEATAKNLRRKVAQLEQAKISAERAQQQAARELDQVKKDAVLQVKQAVANVRSKLEHEEINQSELQQSMAEWRDKAIAASREAKVAKNLSERLKGLRDRLRGDLKKEQSKRLLEVQQRDGEIRALEARLRAAAAAGDTREPAMPDPSNSAAQSGADGGLAFGGADEDPFPDLAPLPPSVLSQASPQRSELGVDDGIDGKHEVKARATVFTRHTRRDGGEGLKSTHPSPRDIAATVFKREGASLLALLQLDVISALQESASVASASLATPLSLFSPTSALSESHPTRGGGGAGAGAGRGGAPDAAPHTPDLHASDTEHGPFGRLMHRTVTPSTNRAMRRDALFTMWASPSPARSAVRGSRPRSSVVSSPTDTGFDASLPSEAADSEVVSTVRRYVDASAHLFSVVQNLLVDEDGSQLAFLGVLFRFLHLAETSLRDLQSAGDAGSTHSRVLFAALRVLDSLVSASPEARTAVMEKELGRQPEEVRDSLAGQLTDVGDLTARALGRMDLSEDVNTSGAADAVAELYQFSTVPPVRRAVGSSGGSDDAVSVEALLFPIVTVDTTGSVPCASTAVSTMYCLVESAEVAERHVLAPLVQSGALTKVLQDGRFGVAAKTCAVRILDLLARATPEYSGLSYYDGVVSESADIPPPPSVEPPLTLQMLAPMFDSASTLLVDEFHATSDFDVPPPGVGSLLLLRLAVVRLIMSAAMSANRNAAVWSTLFGHPDPRSPAARAAERRAPGKRKRSDEGGGGGAGAGSGGGAGATGRSGSAGADVGGVIAARLVLLLHKEVDAAVAARRARGELRGVVELPGGDDGSSGLMVEDIAVHGSLEETGDILIEVDADMDAGGARGGAAAAADAAAGGVRHGMKRRRAPRLLPNGRVALVDNDLATGVHHLRVCVIRETLLMLTAMRSLLDLREAVESAGVRYMFMSATARLAECAVGPLLAEDCAEVAAELVDVILGTAVDRAAGGDSGGSG